VSKGAHADKGASTGAGDIFCLGDGEGGLFFLVSVQFKCAWVRAVSAKTSRTYRNGKSQPFSDGRKISSLSAK